ncbi:hypothetical protein, partial [Mucilaginibacter lappiensis]|uniref:hypothetical protein n=1 Tax=Mucilaginibacter lappiensis TaxID=354630 RepID=UPI001C379D0A
TRDPDLGKVVLYQLSYFRVGSANIDRKPYSASRKMNLKFLVPQKSLKLSMDFYQNKEIKPSS